MFRKRLRNVHSRAIWFWKGLQLSLIAVVLSFSNPANADTQSSASRDLVAFVQEAVSLIQEEGEAAFSQFRKSGGKWFHGERYVFVWGLDGMRYVYPPDIAGERKNMLHLKDINDKPIGEWLIAKARSPEAGGWIHYQWPRPGDIFPVWKSTYVQRAVAPSGKVYAVGSGRYNMPLERAFVIALIDEAARMLSEQGRKGFARLKDRTDEFIFMDTYVFVLSLDGTEHVNPAFPNLEGRNLLDYKDAAGKYLVREMIKKTENGHSAWVEYFWPRPRSGEPTRKVAYVRRVSVGGKPLILGAGLYESSE